MIWKTSTIFICWESWSRRKEFYLYISFRPILLIIFQLLFDKIYIDYGYYIHISNHLFNIGNNINIGGKL